MSIRFVAAFAAVLFAAGAGSFASAQQAATPAPASTPAPNPVPSVPAGIEQDAINAIGNIVKGAFGWSDTEAIGTVTYFRGYDMQLRMPLNRFRDIHLHRGTVINPRGWTIAAGQYLDVRGRPRSDGSLDADTIVVQHAH